MGARSVVLAVAIVLFFLGCARDEPEDGPAAAQRRAMQLTSALETRIPELIREHRIAGIGIALIADGRVEWSGFFGEQAVGVPASADTMFNGASMAKTITAETVLRMVDAGLLSLDEPVPAFWTEEDLADDPRYGLLTPRIILSHRAGLLNWSFDYPDGRLAFVAEPGSRLTYSGAGYEMLTHFVKAKLGNSLEHYADSLLFEPMELEKISLSRQPWIDPFVAHPMDAAGVYHEPFTYPGTSWVRPVGFFDGSDDLFVSVDDYARFLIETMQEEGLTDRLAAERFRVVADARVVDGWACVLEPRSRCPDPYGYGLGWTVFGFGDRTYIQHGGTDFGEHAMAYFVPETGEGLVVFVNGGNGPMAVLDILDIVEDGHPLGAHFRARYAQLSTGR